MKSIFAIVIVLITASSIFAMDSKRCSNMLNNGLWKKYKYGGVGEANINACTQGSKREGSSTVLSDGTTEASTASVDTKYTSNVWTSQTQSTSSFGECNAFAQSEQMKKDREIYIAQNESEVLMDIARGNGEHLKVVTFYSACPPEAYKELSSNLQKLISDSEKVPNSKSICQNIDSIISKNQSLKEKCALRI